MTRSRLPRVTKHPASSLDGARVREKEAVCDERLCKSINKAALYKSAPPAQHDSYQRFSRPLTIKYYAPLDPCADLHRSLAMSYHSPYGHAYSNAPSQHPSLSWGTSSSVTANGNHPPPSSTRLFKGSVSDANDAASVYSFGVPSHFSWPSSAESEQTIRVTSPVAKQDNRSVALQSRSSKHTHSATVPTTAASPSIFNDHVRRMTLSPGAYLPHPFLEPGSVWCDFAYPPSIMPGTTNYNPKMRDPAFSPPLQRIVIYFCDNHRWSVSIAYNKDLSIFDILSEIYYYLQLPNDEEASAFSYAMRDLRNQSRERNASSRAFHSGRRRLDILGRRRIFYGLIPSGYENQTWLLQLSEPTDENFSI